MQGYYPSSIQPPFPASGGVPGISGIKAGQPTAISDIEKSMTDLQAGMTAPTQLPIDMGTLTQFGYNFFRPDAIGFAPLMDIPVGPDYVIGAGDRIIVNVWGSIEAFTELEVNRSGDITLPRVGTVKVAGTTFGKLTELLRTHISKVFKGFDLNVTMGKLRLIKVYVVGEVTAPGDYNISSLSTLINALSAAGGPTKKGSLRNIQVRRRDSLPESVDLYDFFLRGDKGRDIRLHNGDTILVPSIGKVAAIAGNVRRPAIYELKDENNLRELLTMADGIIPSSYLQRVQILRIKSHEKQVAEDFNINPGSASGTIEEQTARIVVQDMDFVKVFPIDRTQRNSVRLMGYVMRPGDYALTPGMRVRDVIGKDNLKLWEYNSEVALITRMTPPDYTPSRIYINLRKAMDGDPANNIQMQEYDALQVFSKWDMQEMPIVNVSGEVQRPGTYRLYDKMRLRDLILEAGNLKNTAYQGNAEITRLRLTRESVTSYSINVNLQQALTGNDKYNIQLEPYDEVQIRRIPNWLDETSKYITLKGEVTYPGVYAIYKGEKLSSVIQRAGGFTDRAYLRGVKFFRQPVKDLQQKRMDEVLQKTQDDVIKKQSELTSAAASKDELDATKAALQGLLQNLDRLRQAKAEGRVSIRLDTLDKFRGSPYDIELMGGDSLEVPQSTNAVAVLGEVYNPTTLLQIPGKDVSYYLKKAGGPTQSAEEDEMYVIKADGTVFSRQESSYGMHWDDDGKRWTFGGFFANQLEAGDTLVVPQKITTTSLMRDIKDITTIISQIALSAGTIFLGLK
jgi:protein involved in polysaccharide export with SLBB domain